MPPTIPSVDRPMVMNLPGMQQCWACKIRGPHTSRVVPGYGIWPNKVMIVAQSPGKEENARGIPLIGPSGKLLADACKSIGWDLDRLFRTNINHCHPKLNRKALPSEVAACLPWLWEEIEAVDPDIIIPMGDTAYSIFLPDEKSPITQINGSVFERVVHGRNRYVIPMVHPAFVARNQTAHLPTFISNLSKAKRIADEGTYETGVIPFRKTEATWEEILDAVQSPEWGFDLETPSIYGHQGEGRMDVRIIGIGVCSTPGNGLYHPVTAQDLPEKLATLKHYLESDYHSKIISNVEFEDRVLRRYGIRLCNYHDTQIEAWLLGDVPRSLKDGFHALTGIEMIRIDKFKDLEYTRRDWRGEMALDMEYAQECDRKLVVEYAAQDPDASLRLHRAYYPRLRNRGLIKLYNNELQIARIIVDTEWNGFGFQADKLDPVRDELNEAVVKTQAHCQDLVGPNFDPRTDKQKEADEKRRVPKGIPPYNPGSWQQNAKALYEMDSPYKLEPKKIIKGGEVIYEYPTDKVGLAEHGANPLVRAMLTYKAATQLRGFTDSLPTWVDRDQRIRAHIKQTTASTGRAAYEDPNLQQIPTRLRDDIDLPIKGSRIREAFVAQIHDQVQWLIAAPDYSQIEMRVAAHSSGDENMISIISNGGDLHDFSAEKIYKVKKADVEISKWENMRYLAKTVGFGVLYGLTPVGLLLRTPGLNLTLAEAEAIINGFYAAYPKLREWQAYIREFTRKHGYAETLLKRRRYLPDIWASDRKIRGEAERQAVNVPVQGSAADIFKLGLIAVDEKLKELNLRSFMVAQVHDEIVLECPPDEIDIIATEIVPTMSNVYPLRVPVKVDMEYGISWGKLTKWKNPGEVKTA